MTSDQVDEQVDRVSPDDAQSQTAAPPGAGAQSPAEPEAVKPSESEVAQSAEADAAPEATEHTEEAADETDETDDERRERAESFAKEHDPAEHDVAKGEEFRQPGDWTADEAGGPQVWDSVGHLTDESSSAEPGTSQEASSSDGGAPTDADSHAAQRFSSLEDVRDGGYGVGSAAPLDDGVVPFGHEVRAWEDTKTFVAAGYPGYDDVPAHVWFVDEEAARRAGFSHVD